MMIVGMGTGILFALLILAISVGSFPLMLDRHVGLPQAVATSVQVATTNPGPVAAWGLAVAVLMALASVPRLLGMIVVNPILGHGTWHFYRRAIAHS